jgi:hypothetical protein
MVRKMVAECLLVQRERKREILNKNIKILSAYIEGGTKMLLC